MASAHWASRKRLRCPLANGRTTGYLITYLHPSYIECPLAEGGAYPEDEIDYRNQQVVTDGRIEIAADTQFLGRKVGQRGYGENA